jgi:hypothetical protein
VSSPAISQHELSLPDGYALRAFRESDLQELHALAERLGFRLEGVLRQSYRIDDGRYSDDAVYSMLASDPQRAALTDLASGARSSDVATLG